MIGHVDLCSHVVIKGWSADPAVTGFTEVGVYADGTLVTTGVANLFRSDLLRHGIRKGKAGFKIPISLPLGPNPIKVSVRTIHTDTELANSPQVLDPALGKKPEEYQEEVRVWLNNRFGPGGWVDGVFLAHQPIYGFRVGHSEPDWAARYLITYHLMRNLSQLTFDSLLDVGGAEGYKAALAKKLFGCSVLSCDISSAACQRAEELYGLNTHQVDIHELPFDDNTFDVVMASETIEHVIDCRKALGELLRVANKAVVITVPHETLEEVAETIKKGDIHGHIHHFNTHSFEFLKEGGFEVRPEQIVSFSPLIRVPSIWMECRINEAENSSSLWSRLWLRIRQKIFSERLASACLSWDSWLLRWHSRAGYAGVLCVIAKDPTVFQPNPSRPVSVIDIVKFRIPLHRKKHH